jgi:Xaa-Pro aminopeptidase
VEGGSWWRAGLVEGGSREGRGGVNEVVPMDVVGRVPRLRAAMARPDDLDGVDALVVTKLVNVRYLTGFTGSAGLVLVLPDELLLVTDGRYGQQAAEQLEAAGVAARIVVAGVEQREVVGEAVRTAGVSRLALEADAVTWAQQRAYAESWFAGIELVATTGLVDDLRLIKDVGEVSRIEAAAAVADEALARVRPRLLDGLTEQEFGIELDFEIRRLGAWGNSFETIVGSGPNGAKPHHRPSRRRIAEGDLVVLDFGAVVDGYCSDMTRTVMVGDPSPTQARMLDVVTEAQAAGVAAVAPGVATATIDAACRQVIADAGWADAFLHATGHGVGLEIHEAPRVAATAAATLAPGVVVTVEPGVYLPDHGGVRVEDTLVVTADGSRPLTLAPKTTAV